MSSRTFTLDSQSERLRKIYDKQAAGFDRQVAFFERHLFQGGREWACSQASGDVLEIAAGTGRNLEYFTGEARITGIEFSPKMLELARERGQQVRPDADLRLGDAQNLEFPDESFDTVVCTLSLCTIPDDAKAVREAKRVLRPGGHIILMEHVGSPVRPVRWVQRFIEVFSLRFEGDHQTREPLKHLRREGFEIEELVRLKWGIVERVVPASRRNEDEPLRRRNDGNDVGSNVGLDDCVDGSWGTAVPGRRRSHRLRVGRRRSLALVPRRPVWWQAGYQRAATLTSLRWMGVV